MRKRIPIKRETPVEDTSVLAYRGKSLKPVKKALSYTLQEKKVLTEIVDHTQQQSNVAPAVQEAPVVEKISHMTPVGFSLKAVEVDDKTRELLTKNITYTKLSEQKENEQLTQSISSKSQDIVAQSKILLDETMRQLKVDLHKLRYGQELLEEQHDKHNDNVFYQQALSTMLCEYSIKARVSLGMQQFQSILAEAGITLDQGTILGALSHALVLGYFQQQKFRDKYIVLDFTSWKGISVMLDEYCHTDLIVIDKGYLLRNKSLHIPIYCVDAKTTPNNGRKGHVSLGKIKKGLLPEEGDISVLPKLEDYMQKAIWKALYEHSNNDPALAAFIASRGKGPRWQYDFWSFRVATGISFDEWRELSKGKKRVYTVHQDMEKKMKTNFLIPNSLL